MKTSFRVLSVLLALVMMLSVAFTSCRDNKDSNDTSTLEETTPDGTKAPGDEYRLPLEEGYNQLTIYWTHKSADYATCDIWIWWGDKAGQGYLFHECDYGAKVVLNVPEGITEVGFIVRRDCSEPGGSSWGSATKDFESDRFVVLEGRETVIYLKPGVGDQFISNDGGKTLEMIRKFSLAGIVDQAKLQYSVTPKTTISSLDQVKVYEGDRQIAVTNVSSLGKELYNGYIEIAEPFDLSKNYRVEIEGYGSKAIVPTKIFDSEYFAENFHYDGDDLGAIINGDNTTFKVWAPTASKVLLNLFAAGNGVDAYKTVEMVKGEKGVWSHTEECGHGTYYTYTVTTSVGTQEAVDPYAKAAGVNGNRGMVVDLSLTNPEGWENAGLSTTISSYSQAIIWEVHVRDFSNKIADSNYKGKYLAFTETGLVNEHGQPIGVDYLKELGITHVHLLPVYDYATVDESNPDAEFNWGYDPKNYNVPEGSYSTDPFNGAVRINEYKQMVQALHAAGIGVIMDVVYNHTYDANSSFNKIVPYYCYRYTDTGVNSSASGCGNDTASERYMYGKFMVDSTSYWVEEYKLDGLRFDLMGLHDLATTQEVETAVHTINPQAVIYGEGWTMGSTIDGSRQANQSNIKDIVPSNNAIGGIAVFNDAIRDGLKGSVFEKTSRGYISGAANNVSLAKVLFGIRGGQDFSAGWIVKDNMVINYMSAHDNHTLWDKLSISCPNDSEEARNRMNKFGAAIVMISQGTPFWQAGEEMLRTKNGDENSYKSGDAINNIDWSVLKEGSMQYQTMLYYKGLIEMRKAYGILTSNVEIQPTELGGGAVALRMQDGNGGEMIIVINPYNNSIPYALEGEWNLIANGEQAGTAIIGRVSGNINVDGLSVQVYVNDAMVK